MKWLAVVALGVMTLPAFASAPQLLAHGRFEKVRVYSPAAPAKSVVLLLSDAAGWQPQEQRQAEALAAEGALVVGIDSRQFLQALAADSGDCVFPDGDLENLSHFVQAYAQLPGYRAPVLAGSGAGAALAYATLAQAPTGTFSAGLATHFRPVLNLKKTLCPGDGLRYRPLANGRGVQLLPRTTLAVPFLALLGSREPAADVAATQVFIAEMPAARQVLLPGVGHRPADERRVLAALRAALRTLMATQTATVPPAPSELGDLPVVEEPVTGNSPYLAIFWSGDGGWAGIDKEVASVLNRRGIAVVGVDSLRYFWRARTPAGIAADIEQISRHYLAAWQKQKIVLIGYSQGADVLPFAVNQLDPALRQKIALVAAMGLSGHAVFEFELGNWVSDNNDGPATLPEIARIRDLPFLCIYGEDEDDSVCPQLLGSRAQVAKLPGGHHFDGDYEKVAETILAALPK